MDALRWATVDDVDELVRLRAVMFDSMGMVLDEPMQGAAGAALRRGLPTGEFFAAVVDSGEGWLAACGVGMKAVRLPGPRCPDGVVGYVQSMVTDERARRRGHARAVLAALLARFDADGVARVDLHATDMGAPLYRSVGFVEPRTPELQRRLA